MPIVEVIQATNPAELAVRIKDTFAAWESMGGAPGVTERKVANLSMAMTQTVEGMLVITLAFDLERLDGVEVKASARRRTKEA